MLVIVKSEDQNKLSNLLGYDPIIYSFKEMFSKYKNSVKKKYLATEEIFSLAYDTTLSDLKRSIWVSINEEDISKIKNKIKILEKIYEYLIKNYNAKTLDEYAEEYNENSDDWRYSSSYVIKAKNPKNKKYEEALCMINNLFDYDACYC